MRAPPLLLALLLAAIAPRSALAQAIPTPCGAAPAPDPVAPAAAAAAPGELRTRVGGYAQVQLRSRQDSAAQLDEDGFRLARGRLAVGATRDLGCIDADLAVEAEMAPDFQLLDAALSLRGALLAGGRWRLQVGQFKAPVSREALLSDARVGFVNKAELASLAPERQIGAGGDLDVPGAPWLQLSFGIFNGEGRNVGDNVDQHFLFAGRLAVRPLGRNAPLADGGFGPTRLAVAISAARNVRDLGDNNETVGYLGFDVSGAWRGLSGAVEYLLVDHVFDDGAPEGPYQAYGWNAQLAYLLPAPGRLDRRFEVAARWEAIDRNDAIYVEVPGDVNQTLIYYTLGLGYYHREHALKAQLSLSHIQEYEERDRNDEDATYDNDTLLLQVTYVME